MPALSLNDGRPGPCVARCASAGCHARKEQPITLRQSYAGLGIIGLGTGAAALDTAVNVAFPALSQALAIPVASIQWIVISYMLPFGALMLVCGRLGDSIGHLTVFRIGLAASTVAFIVTALAPTTGILLAGRGLQGAGAAATLSCAPALATALFPESQRFRALGLYGALFAIAAGIGPILGGLLVDAFGWRGVFGFRAPLVLLSLLLSWRLGIVQPERQTFHAADAALLTIGVATLLLAITAVQWPAARLLALALAATGVAALLLFSRVQQSAATPFMPNHAMSDPGILAYNLLNLLVSGAAFAVLLLVPYDLAARGYTPIPLGMILATSSCGVFAGSLLATRYGPRVGAAQLSVIGILMCILGLGGVATWTDETVAAAQVFTLALQGLGVGLFTVAYMDAVTGALPIADRGLSGSIATATRTFGVVGGAALFSVLFQGFLAAAGGTADDFRPAFRACFLAASLGLLVCSLLVAAWRRWLGARRP